MWIPSRTIFSGWWMIKTLTANQNPSCYNVLENLKRQTHALRINRCYRSLVWTLISFIFIVNRYRAWCERALRKKKRVYGCHLSSISNICVRLLHFAAVKLGIHCAISAMFLLNTNSHCASKLYAMVLCSLYAVQCRDETWLLTIYMGSKHVGSPKPGTV